MSGRLDGQVAMITGGAKGIGEATVRRFVAEGARVVIADLDEVAGQRLADELGDAARFVPTDVSQEDDIAAAVDAGPAAFGRLDIVFNNAGIIGAIGPIASLDAEAYDKTMAVLLRSCALGMKHAARVMIPQGSGAILSTSSVAATSGGMGAHTYSTAKAGVMGLTRSVAAELWPHGIRVNALMPGKITTPMTADLRQRLGAPAAPLAAPPGDWRVERRGEADDIAGAALFLASDEARFITGETLRVDGGLTRAGGTSPFLVEGGSTPTMLGSTT